jgi:hypothetical protein
MDVIINSERFSANDAYVYMYGRQLIGCTRINYTEKQSIAKSYVVGTKNPVGSNASKQDFSGEMELLSDEYFALKRAGKGSLLGLPPGDIVITMMRPGVPAVTETIKSVRFSEAGVQIQGGEPDQLKYKLSFEALDVVNK